MLKLADISVFENLQAEANHRLGVQSPMSVFNSVESCASQIAKMAKGGTFDRNKAIDVIAEELLVSSKDNEANGISFGKEFELLRSHIGEALSPYKTLSNNEFEDMMMSAYDEAKRKRRASIK